jgi:catechol 2,3-dioxygenase-like lactoylglutathione lyase family enzyme
MAITGIIPQLRTTDMAASIRFYTDKLGFSVEFNHDDFYVGIRAGGQLVHLKFVCEKDPSIAYVEDGGHLHLYFQTDDVAALAAELKDSGVPLVKDVHDTDWGTREVVIQDNQGHTLYFGEPREMRAGS